MLNAHLTNVGIKSALSFLPFFIFLIIENQGKNEFNDFSYFYSIFNIFYGFIGLPIYQFILVNDNKGKLTSFFSLTHKLNLFTRLTLTVFAILFYLLDLSEFCIIMISAIYSIYIASSAVTSRSNNFFNEIFTNIIFFIILIIFINIIGYSSTLPFLISSLFLLFFSISKDFLKDYEQTVFYFDAAELKLIAPYILISGLGSLIAYGDMILAVKFLEENDAYNYIWFNRAILGSTILCVGFSNLLMSNNKIFSDYPRIIKITFIAIATALIFSFVASGILRFIIDKIFLDSIFYIVVVIVVTKYITVFPSIALVHANCQDLRIISTILASLFYAMSLIINSLLFGLDIWTLIFSILIYHLFIFVFNSFFILKKQYLIT